jgi:hypothetical protein
MPNGYPSQIARYTNLPTNRMKKNQWQAGTWMLPHSAHLPVEVELADGTVERRATVSGDWRQVVRWRMVDKEAADRQRKRK